jgi:hypothetical protein
MSGNGTTVGGAGRREQDAFFDRSMYVVDVQGWPADRIRPDRPLQDWVRAPAGARLRIGAAHPHDTRHVPPPEDGSVVLDTADFALRNSGNRTLWAPKRSWKVDLDDGDDRVAGMSCLNLKSMYNDASQMREALAWGMFGFAGVTAPRHTYARLGVNGRYLGLFSVIEQVDKEFLAGHFPGKVRGNLIKVSCGEIGGGTLEHRVGPDGDDGGAQYATPGSDDPTYRVKSWSRGDGAESLDDLAHLVRAVNGVGLPGGDERFGSDAFAGQVRGVLAVEEFLRWAGVNVLVGAWDNYFATPANYYLYNAGRPGPGDPVDDPFFTFVPWDYDNTFGIDYVGTAWHETDLLDWPANTERYWRRNGNGGRSRIPLVQNLLRNTGFRRYYLDHIEHLLDTCFCPRAVDRAIGTDGDAGLWDRVARSAFLESDTAHGWPFTGRQFTNDEVYRGGYRQEELRHDTAFVLGIHHYVRMRYDRAREQLAHLRRDDPPGSSGVVFGTALRVPA